MLLTTKLRYTQVTDGQQFDVAIRYSLVMTTGLSSGVEDHWKR